MSGPAPAAGPRRAEVNRLRVALELAAVGAVLVLAGNSARNLLAYRANAAAILAGPAGADRDSQALARLAPVAARLAGTARADYVDDTDVDPTVPRDGWRRIHAQYALAPTVLAHPREGRPRVFVDLADPALLDAAMRVHRLRTCETVAPGLYLCER